MNMTQNTSLVCNKLLNTNRTVLNTLNANARYMIQNRGRRVYKSGNSFHRYLGDVYKSKTPISNCSLNHTFLHVPVCCMFYLYQDSALPTEGFGMNKAIIT